MNVMKHTKVTKYLSSHNPNICTLCLSPVSVDQRAFRHVQSRCVRHHTFSQGSDSPVALAGEDWARGQMAVDRQLLFAGGPPDCLCHSTESLATIKLNSYVALNCRCIFIHLRRKVCSLFPFLTEWLQENFYNWSLLIAHFRAVFESVTAEFGAFIHCGVSVSRCWGGFPGRSIFNGFFLPLQLPMPRSFPSSPPLAAWLWLSPLSS